MILDIQLRLTGGGVFDSPITSEKSGVTFDVSSAQAFRSTATDGDPTMLNGVERGGSNSAVDVIPVVNGSNNGLMSPTMLSQLNSHETRLIRLENYRWSSTSPNRSYMRYVIGFINVDNSDINRTSVFIGNIKAYRSNGLYNMCNIETTICKKYNQSQVVSSWLSVGGNPETFRPVTFLYNGVRYGGFEYKMSDAETHYIELDGLFAGNLPPVFIPFKDDNSGSIINAEINNSLTVGDIANDAYNNGYKIWRDGDRITNAVWNDYAELFERGSKTEPGDLIAIDTNSDTEKYTLANEHTFNRVVGVHSDSYGFLIGGERPNDDTDFLQYNLHKYIPVGLSGRVRTKVTGTCKKGDYLVASTIDGVARKYKTGVDDPLLVFGIACEDKTNDSIERIKVYLK